MDLLNKEALVIEIDQDAYAQWLNTNLLPKNSQIIIDNTKENPRVFLLKAPEKFSKKKKSISLEDAPKIQLEHIDEPKKSWVSSFVSKLEKKKDEKKEEKVLERKLTPVVLNEKKKKNVPNNELSDKLKIKDFQKAWEVLDDQKGIIHLCLFFRN